MQALDADKLHCQQLITLLTYARYTTHTHIHISEAILDLPLVLQAVPAFRWSRKCAKTARGELQTFAYWLFHAITFERKVFSKIHLSKSKKRLRETREYCCLLVSTDAETARAGTDRQTDTHGNYRNPCACALMVKNQMKGGIGMANYEKQVEQEAAYPIPISLYNCYRTVRHEKRYQEYNSYASLLMPHCPVTVVQIYRDGVCSLLFFIICHPYIPFI